MIAHALRHFEVADDLLEALAVGGVGDLARDAAAAGGVGHQHRIAAGERQVGGQRRALVAALFLDDLHQHHLPALDHFLDLVLAGRGARRRSRQLLERVLAADRLDAGRRSTTSTRGRRCRLLGSLAVRRTRPTPRRRLLGDRRRRRRARSSAGCVGAGRFGRSASAVGRRRLGVGVAAGSLHRGGAASAASSVGRRRRSDALSTPRPRRWRAPLRSGSRATASRRRSLGVLVPPRPRRSRALRPRSAPAGRRPGSGSSPGWISEKARKPWRLPPYSTKAACSEGSTRVTLAR